MKFSRNQRLTLWGLLFLILGLTGLLAAAKKKPTINGLEERQRAVHALNRLTFGARPGDVDRVMQVGVDKWIDEQLHPEKISDAGMDARLSAFRTLTMSTQEIVTRFPPPQVIRAAASGRMKLPNDPAQRAIYEAQIDRMAQKKEAKAAPSDEDDNAMTGAQKQERRDRRRVAREKFDELMDLPADQRMSAILKMSPDERAALARGLNEQDRMQLYESMSPEQREQLMALRNPELVVVTELQQAKLLRAAYSERQLQEVMTDFWFNHFNVFINKGPDRYLTTAYERDVIRPHALGKFKDILLATAKSPAMLWYLDNWDSVGPNSDFARYGPKRLERLGRYARRRSPQVNDQIIQKVKQNMPKGLNENYARELMELHTLGVDGGYTQHDVTEVAKAFTGWTIRQPRRGGSYEFDERRHEPGPKFVLGKNIKEHGEKEGEEVLEMLARNTHTAQFISQKLAMRFVSDNPPKALVDSMANTFLKTDGDIREVLRTMLKAPEFWSHDTYRAKVKTPLEFVVSSIRATNADIRNALPLIQTLNKMGMPLYLQQPPTGYSMKADAWVNSAALLNRMNFALGLASGKLPGIGFDAQQAFTVQSDSPEQAIGSLEDALLAGDVSKQTHETILKQMADPQLTGVALNGSNPRIRTNVIAGLILGSPEFQRR
jgi:uncharacterized protein (DUF1800 family)